MSRNRHFRDRAVGQNWFPLNSTFAPRIFWAVHNHGTWGLVAVLKGQDKNTFWQGSHDRDFAARIEPVSEKILNPGDMIGLTPDAIHSIEAVGSEPTITLIF